MKRELGIGIVGCGLFADFCIEAFSKIDGVKVVALCDTGKARLDFLSKKYDIEKTYLKFSRFVKDPKIDIVHISTPPFLHAKQIIQCAKHKKHIFCEKPLATSLKQAKSAISAVKKHKVELVVNHVMRFNPYYLALEKIVRSKILKDAHRFYLENHAQDEVLPRKHWFWNRRLSGGIMIEHGVHFFDIMAHIFGEPKPITAFQRIRAKTDQEDTMYFAAIYNNKTVGTFFHSFNKAKEIEHTWLEIIFPKGYLHIDGWIPTALTGTVWLSTDEKHRLQKLLPELNLKTLEYKNKIYKTRAGGKVIKYNHKCRFSLNGPKDKEKLYLSSIKDNMAEMVECIRMKKKHRITLEECLESVKIASIASKRRRV